MPYVKTTWVNGSVPAINATNLNHIETGIDEVTDTAEAAATSASAAYRPAGTDVAMADGGTGASLSDPSADRLLFWDDSVGAVTWLVPGTNVSISGTTLDVTGTIHTILDEGVSLTNRSGLDFVGAGVTVTDDSGSNKSVVTIPAISSGSLTVATKTGAYTTTTSDNILLADATSAAFTITLVTAVGNGGKVFYIKRLNSGANAVTVDPTGSQTIDGALTFALSNQYDAITVASDGANWVIL